MRSSCDSLTLIANSIGAFFSMTSLSARHVDRALFISPVVDMERLIADMMARANVTENDLRKQGTIQTADRQELSWEYLSWVRRHPIKWIAPTEILYGSRDNLTDFDTIDSFAGRTGARLTIMDGGEHWFHTDEQMRFIDNWILSNK
jgi:pimeloyl-ACP methyl ester carboxylesterase